MGDLSKLVDVLTREIGYRETGNNDTKYNRWLGRIAGYPHGGYGYPWCAAFASWAYDKAGFVAGRDVPRTASCAVGVKWYRDRKRWGSAPRVGAQVYYGPGGGTHTEIVVDVDGTHITTIGGNTGGSLNGTYYNGDGVYRKRVARSNSRIYGYGYPVGLSGSAPAPAKSAAKSAASVPAWPGRYLRNTRPMMSGSDVRQWQSRMRARGWSLSVDGWYGPESERVCRQFQLEKRLGVDGIVGPVTWRAAWTAPVT